MYTISPTDRVWAEINMAALLHNFEIAQASRKKVMCVVKSDAYGHGAARCARFLEAHGADAFAVATLKEALTIRGAGVTKPVLILGYTPANAAPLLAANSITATLIDEEYAIALDDEARKAGVSVTAHIKLDTGMTRTGLFAQNEASARVASEAAMRMLKLKNVRVTGMFTHFAVADTPSEDAFTAHQFACFGLVADTLRKAGFDPGTLHASNSAAILSHPETKLDMVRAGALLYGITPDGSESDGTLEPVMTLKARVAQVRKIEAGSTVSYGRMFRAEAPMTLALICAGYADGFPRRLSNLTYDVINGCRCRQVGAICMDMHLVDVTGLDVKRGDEVTLLGAGGMSWEQAAKLTGTINYELVCLVTDRAERVYIGER